MEGTAVRSAAERIGRRPERLVVASLRTIIDAIDVLPAVPQEPRPETSMRGLDARQLRLVHETIRERIGETISVSMLSGVAGLSRSHFSHAFRASVGRPPHAHVVRLRIERAMKLMVETDMPLSEIALAAGFSDQAHFSKKFRRAAGMTPMQWRRVMR